MMRVVGGDFRSRCEALFGKPHGGRWKSACAEALKIGRASLYRYFEDGTVIPQDVLTRLAKLEGSCGPGVGGADMVALYARALLEVQDELDHRGSLRHGYPETLRRAFDLAAALNTGEGSENWPVELGQLVARARQPIYRWLPDLSWDPGGEFTAARLIENGAVSADCFELAARGRNPEAELHENSGYERLRSIALSRADGEDFYRAWRRMVIERPVIQELRHELDSNRILLDREAPGLLDRFYQPVPQSLAVLGTLRICKISGTILRPLDAGGKMYETDCRDPKAVKLAVSGSHDVIEFTPATRQLIRPFRLYWCLPGRAELELAHKLAKASWSCRLWPALDKVDLEATSRDGRRKIAIDVKDYLSPKALAKRFEGFKEFSRDHECFLVVPDYVRKITKDFERRFEAWRSSWNKVQVKLRTVSSLLKELQR
jgi:hypothetical protein